MATTFNTNKFQGAHGKAPRGFGFWFFTNTETGAEFVHVGTYTEAKRAASVEFKNATVTVEP